MSPSNPNKPPEEPPDQVLVTTSGVRIVVSAPPPPPPPRPPPPPKPIFPDAIVVPANLPPDEMAAIIKGLCEQHREFVVKVLQSRRDVLQESKRDLAQNVMVALWRYIEEKHQVPINVKGFLVDLIEKEVIDHHRRMGRTPALDREADAEAVRDNGPDPEEVVDTVLHMEKVKRCMARLPHEQAEAIRYVDLLEQTLEKTAKALQRPLSTFAAQRDRGLENLKVLATAPDPPPPLGHRRRR